MRKLPAAVLLEFYPMLMLPLVTRLANEDSPSVRKLLPSCLAVLITRLPPAAADGVVRQAVAWAQESNWKLRYAGALLLTETVAAVPGRALRHADVICAAAGAGLARAAAAVHDPGSAVYGRSDATWREAYA